LFRLRRALRFLAIFGSQRRLLHAFAAIGNPPGRVSRSVVLMNAFRQGHSLKHSEWPAGPLQRETGTRE
jgi:hypothetical protein